MGEKILLIAVLLLALYGFCLLYTSGHNLSTITVQFFFSTDGEDAAIRVFDLFKVPEDRHDKIYKDVYKRQVHGRPGIIRHVQ